MSSRVTIRRTDGAPLGNVAGVKRHLTDAFPGMQFRAVDGDGDDLAPGGPASLFRRIWLASIGRRICHAYWTGAYGGPGYALELYFEASEPVLWVRATVSTPTPGLREHLDRLCQATGWSAVFSR
jgi:hypothetical protein